jgi:glutamate--cysteine ligase
MSDSPDNPSTDDAPLKRADLDVIFREAEKPSADFLIGVEEEKFGVHEQTLRPLGYEGDFGVRVVMEDLAERHGWECVREQAGGPPISLHRGAQSITLEPGAQFELSGAPLRTLREILAERDQHRQELEPISSALGIRWLNTGFHPTAALSDLPWVPKVRYPVMREYLPTRGPAAHDMMQRTATVQANYDYSSEEDAMKKLVVSLRVAPILQAMFVNAPFKEGRTAGRLSERGNVWLHMDPSRSGLIPNLWTRKLPGYDDYIEWALDAGMFLIWRGNQPLRNTGQTFRDFLEHGYQGHHATLSDWRLHLATLFPEARLKSTLEVRPLDALPRELAIAAVGVWTGVLYDQQALDGAYELTQELEFDAVERARPGLVTRGLDAGLPGKWQDGYELAKVVLSLAQGGLSRRAEDCGLPDESQYLAPIVELVEARSSPAEEALRRHAAGQSILDSCSDP